MLKTRFEVAASSLGAYFGVGFNEPLTQLNYDLGLEENIIDEESQDRMNLGIFLEDAVLNYFENKLGISITDRNTEVIYAFDGRLKCKVDGMTIYGGVITGVECKVSNSQKKFYNDKGYYLQAQAYMKAKGVDQWLMLGLLNGKPVFRVIQRSESAIALIESMVDYLYACYNGILTPLEYPFELIDAYSPQPALASASVEEDLAYFNVLMKKKNEISAIEKEIKPIEDYLKSRYTNVVVDLGESGKCTISTQTRQGTVDIDLILSLLPPNIDLADYTSEPTTYSVIRFTKSKKKAD